MQLLSELVSIQEEKWKGYFQEALPLWKEHYAEVGPDADRFPFEPDTHLYQVLEEQGALSILTMRKKGKMIGYFVGAVLPYAYSKSHLVLHEHLLFIQKKHRCLAYANELMRRVDALALARGVKKILFSFQERKGQENFFYRNGYHPEAKIYGKLTCA